MTVQNNRGWQARVVPPQQVIELIKPGMTVWIGSGPAEPALLVATVLDAPSLRHRDAEMIQAIAGGPALTAALAGTNPLRFKTFAGSEAAAKAGRIEVVPGHLAGVPALIRDGLVPIDLVMVRVSRPDGQGRCHLGPCADATLAAMDKARIVVGEITPDLPATAGGPVLDAQRFAHFVQAGQPLCPLPRPLTGPLDHVIADHLAGLVGDGASLSFFPGPLAEALARALAGKTGLGLHLAWFTDNAMDLVRGGACGPKPVEAGYAVGSRELMDWLNTTDKVVFRDLGTIFDPARIGRSERLITVVPAAAVDLAGRFAIGTGAEQISNAQVEPFVLGARMSDGGMVVAALASRSDIGATGFCLALGGLPTGTADIVVTEQGVARLRGLTLRQRAQALIDIAHPRDRPALVEAAKVADILYGDQLFLAECALDHPSAIGAEATFKGGLRVRFRQIRPSDEEGMRRLFYRFSKEAVYYRYFAPVATMPHEKMQAYVNADCADTVSIVGLVAEGAGERLIAEARYVAETGRPWAEVAFVVDEAVQGKGIATFILHMLVEAARQRGIKGFTAQVLATNKAMLSVFEKGGLALEAKLNQGVYDIRIPFAGSG